MAGVGWGEMPCIVFQVSGPQFRVGTKVAHSNASSVTGSVAGSLAGGVAAQPAALQCAAPPARGGCRRQARQVSLACVSRLRTRCRVSSRAPVCILAANAAHSSSSSAFIPPSSFSSFSSSSSSSFRPSSSTSCSCSSPGSCWRHEPEASGRLPAVTYHWRHPSTPSPSSPRCRSWMIQARGAGREAVPLDVAGCQQCARGRLSAGISSRRATCISGERGRLRKRPLPERRPAAWSSSITTGSRARGSRWIVSAAQVS